ncbi:antirestriction protein [Legionella steelei]|uniref:Antirestriction protein n=1 Tax=Legionella steelei TaxID=947033 RepID=A0A0W0ZCG9_9GAMM|nr:antirestriction protein [Legionella steelei]
MPPPSIYVACLASYSNAILHGVWIDATQSEDDIMEEIWEMLDNSTEQDAEEYASFIQEHGELGLAIRCNYSMMMQKPCWRIITKVIMIQRLILPSSYLMSVTPINYQIISSVI